jgi:HSP20 family protein
MPTRGKENAMSEKKKIVPARIDPFAEFDLFRDWGQPRGISRLMREALQGGEAERWLPPVDIAESGDRYTITVELPGTNKEDVTVECHDNVLTIKGEKKSEREEKGEHRHYVERRYGSFSRAFTLPSDASGDQVKAKFREGVLTVEIVKAEGRKPKVVDIKG